MATRLYPNTDNVTVLAALAGVSLDTVTRYNALVAERDAALAPINAEYAALPSFTYADQEAGRVPADVQAAHSRLYFAAEKVRDAFYEAVYADRDLEAYSSFVTFGWGRVQAPGLGYAGYARNNRKEVVRILSAQPATDGRGGSVLNQLHRAGLKMHRLGGVHWC